jgi:thiosulfate/3-mercaptopyruvate sulfurtransferase
MSHRSLVDPSDLPDLLGRVTVLDVRWALGRVDGLAQYLAGHVPGASYVDLETDLADPPANDERGRHPLPDPDRFAGAMRRCGVALTRPVVVYDDSGGTSAARAWWLLRYHGHPDVRLLDGGWSAYAHAGGPVETGAHELTASAPQEFPADPGHLPVLDAEAAARLARDGVLVDARAPERYRGETEPIDPVAGHVPGAVNVPTADNLAVASDEPARFRPLDELERRYTEAFERVGRDPSAGVGAYCGSGVTAAHDIFALHLLEIDAALYPGSWSGWVADPARPVAR